MKSETIALTIAGAAIALGVYLDKKSKTKSVTTNNGLTYYPKLDMRLNENLPRGYYNNNPLNIRISSDAWRGKVTPNTDGTFEQFVDLAHGYRAALVILRNYINKYGQNTIRKMITRWAPPEDHNDTESYIRNVSKLSGIAADTVISASDKESLVKIAYAMSFSENGYKDKAGQDIKARYDLPNIAIINEGWKLI